MPFFLRRPARLVLLCSFILVLLIYFGVLKHVKDELVKRPIFDQAIFKGANRSESCTGEDAKANSAGAVRLKEDLENQINNATAGFQDILVINLPRRTDRRDAMVLATAYSNLSVNWVEGLDGDLVDDITLPLKPDQDPPLNAAKGSWRAHLNAVSAVIERRLTSALIMEDDLDWDIRLRDQLQYFASSTRALIQPLASGSHASPTYADPSYPHPKVGEDPIEILFHNISANLPPITSPYGDDWDVLWLGHCGMDIPVRRNFGSKHSTGRVVINSENTVPIRDKVDREDGSGSLTKNYPDHTRLVHHAYKPVCTLAYAVSQRGARRILYEMSVREYTSTYDNMLREMCDGEDIRTNKLTCLTTQPTLFTHWSAPGSKKKESDIKAQGDEWQEEGRSSNIRWSMRLNMDKLVKGDTDGWVDQYPNEK